MTFVMFVPGLNGHKSIATQTSLPLPGTNYYAVQQVAHDLSVPCIRAVFQDVSKPYPTLSAMGASIATQIQAMQDTYGDPGLIVASSIGAGVTFQALHSMDADHNLPHVIAFKPVFDPLEAITGALAKVPNGSVYLEKLKAGEIPALPLPVEATSASEDPGHFLLTQAHIDDPKALHLISESNDSFAFFSESLAGRKMESLKILMAENDDVSSQNLTAFSRAVLPHVKENCTLSIIPGAHGDDQSRRLAGEIHKRLFTMLR